MAGVNRLNITLSQQIKDRLIKHSEATGLSQNAIISQALVDYFQKNDLMENSVKIVFELCSQNPELMDKLIEQSKKEDI